MLLNASMFLIRSFKADYIHSIAIAVIRRVGAVISTHITGSRGTMRTRENVCPSSAIKALLMAWDGAPSSHGDPPLMRQ